MYGSIALIIGSDVRAGSTAGQSDCQGQIGADRGAVAGSAPRNSGAAAGNGAAARSPPSPPAHAVCWPGHCQWARHVSFPASLPQLYINPTRPLPCRSRLHPPTQYTHGAHTACPVVASGTHLPDPPPRPPPLLYRVTGLLIVYWSISVCRARVMTGVSGACHDGRVGCQLPCRPCRVGQRLSAVTTLRALLSLAPPPSASPPRQGVLCPLSLVQLVV